MRRKRSKVYPIRIFGGLHEGIDPADLPDDTHFAQICQNFVTIPKIGALTKIAPVGVGGGPGGPVPPWGYRWGRSYDYNPDPKKGDGGEARFITDFMDPLPPYRRHNGNPFLFFEYSGSQYYAQSMICRSSRDTNDYHLHGPICQIDKGPNVTDLTEVINGANTALIGGGNMISAEADRYHRNMPGTGIEAGDPGTLPTGDKQVFALTGVTERDSGYNNLIGGAISMFYDEDVDETWLLQDGHTRYEETGDPEDGTTMVETTVKYWARLAVWHDDAVDGATRVDIWDESKDYADAYTDRPQTIPCEGNSVMVMNDENGDSLVTIAQTFEYYATYRHCIRLRTMTVNRTGGEPVSLSADDDVTIPNAGSPQLSLRQDGNFETGALFYQKWDASNEVWKLVYRTITVTGGDIVLGSETNVTDGSNTYTCKGGTPIWVDHDNDDVTKVLVGYVHPDGRIRVLYEDSGSVYGVHNTGIVFDHISGFDVGSYRITESGPVYTRVPIYGWTTGSTITFRRLISDSWRSFLQIPFETDCWRIALWKSSYYYQDIDEKFFFGILGSYSSIDTDLFVVEAYAETEVPVYYNAIPFSTYHVDEQIQIAIDAWTQRGGRAIYFYDRLHNSLFGPDIDDYSDFEDQSTMAVFEDAVYVSFNNNVPGLKLWRDYVNDEWIVTNIAALAYKKAPGITFENRYYRSPREHYRIGGATPDALDSTTRYDIAVITEMHNGEYSTPVMIDQSIRPDQFGTTQDWFITVIGLGASKQWGRNVKRLHVFIRKSDMTNYHERDNFAGFTLAEILEKSKYYRVPEIDAFYMDPSGGTVGRTSYTVKHMDSSFIDEVPAEWAASNQCPVIYYMRNARTGKYWKIVGREGGNSRVVFAEPTDFLTMHSEPDIAILCWKIRNTQAGAGFGLPIVGFDSETNLPLENLLGYSPPFPLDEEREIITETLTSGATTWSGSYGEEYGECSPIVDEEEDFYVGQLVSIETADPNKPVVFARVDNVDDLTSTITLMALESFQYDIYGTVDGSQVKGYATAAVRSQMVWSDVVGGHNGRVFFGNANIDPVNAYDDTRTEHPTLAWSHLYGHSMPDHVPAANVLRLDSHIIAICKAGDRIVMMKEDGYSVAYVSGLETEWTIQDSFPGPGTTAKNSVVVYGDVIFHLDGRHFRMSQLNGVSQVISEEIHETLGLLDKSIRDTCYGEYFEHEGRPMIFWGFIGDTTAFLFNILEGTWFEITNASGVKAVCRDPNNEDLLLIKSDQVIWFPVDNPPDVVPKWKSKRIDFGQPGQEKIFEGIDIEFASNTNILVNIYIDGSLINTNDWGYLSDTASERVIRDLTLPADVRHGRYIEIEVTLNTTLQDEDTNTHLTVYGINLYWRPGSRFKDSNPAPS